MLAARILKLSMFLVALLGAAQSPAQDAPAAAMGRQRAAASSLEWEVREAGHPALGNIRFAYVKRAIETRVGATTVFTRAYVSCQKDKRSFAIELTNSLGPADPGGLKPSVDPRLYCQRPDNGKVLKEEILASWEVNPKIGDVLARGLRGFPLRECAAITVQQEVVMPEGSPQKTARLEFEILPYNRELDNVFATCGERSAYGPTAPPVAVAAAPPTATNAQQKAAPPKIQAPPPPAKPAPAPVVASVPPPAAAKPAPPSTPLPATAPPATAPPATAPADAGGWREARTVPTGKTNVRAGPSLQTPIVTELFPGAVLMVQGTGEWYRVRPSRGNAFEGYIRQDRLVIK
jgi:hypothetical protein